ncbi:MAG TPA: sugar ABC transporter permease [archaeon]|nr:sugar ABC transporter permease [archaeon]
MTSSTNKKLFDPVKIEPWLYLSPAILLYALILFYPVIQSIVLSFYKWDGMSAFKEFTGFNNYRILFFKDPVFWISLKNNTIFMVTFLLVTNSVCLALALILNRPFSGRVVFRGIFYFPYVISMIAVALIWGWMYHPQLGLINELLRAVGLESLGRTWLGDLKTAFASVIVTASWKAIGIGMVFFLSGLQTLPVSPYESAKLDGANAIQSFFYLTIPFLRETFVIVITLTVISSFKVFDVVYAMTWGGPMRATNVLATWMYFQSFRNHNAGSGTAIATLLVIIMCAIAIPYIMLMSRRSVSSQ